jgi:hypothetical protein
MAHVLELTLVEMADGAVVGEAWVEVFGPNVSFGVEGGERGLARIEVPETWRHLALKVRREGFVPKVVSWRFRQPGGNLPAHFTLKMERGHRIGGMVRNEDGEPVEDANVLITLRGVPCEGIVTDADGRPVEGVAVTLGELGQGSCAVPTRVTDGAGRFRFGGIAATRRQRSRDA